MSSWLKRLADRASSVGLSDAARLSTTNRAGAFNPSPLSRFTVYGAGNKHDLVEKLAQEADSYGLRRTKGQNAVVILASRNHASWLTDKTFMANLLESFSSKSAKVDGDAAEINVLTAAVDGLWPEYPLLPARHGFSIISGPLDHLLPGLWTQVNASPAPVKGQPEKAALTFRVNKADANVGGNATTITLPLANTIFQNSRPFTLLASRWRREGPGSSLAMADMVTSPSREVVCTGSDAAATTPCILMNPITAPRTIVSGLGNIVRQIDMDGKTVPASQELEAAFSLTDEEDLESFIRSFHGQKGGDGEDAPLDSGVVAPGSTIQFFTTAVGELPEPRQADFSLTEHICGELDAFGVSKHIHEKPKVGLGGVSWTILPGKFGAVSSECMYVYNMDAAGPHNGEMGRLQTKVNIPESYISTRPIPVGDDHTERTESKCKASFLC
ncbi:conserved hypothetical protein [Verticillium alfalfae VaMs.102]|uniref:FIST domain-containing protein n=1 Tax=Verticillium alfalfae (strain VaMs.102 / ATCC MYA-4576 / FGSC 10136) TaxID=526221 RepID=C9SHZ3_VERA1|nr:conserved hypothetical protein [Verticillium alfalfae VaMs.102]EEY18566.1 conserved hypothetical protein [Verticillium alfalfae VaMs.102]